MKKNISLKIVLYEEQAWANYENMTTQIDGQENMSYEEKRVLAEKEVKEYISDCKNLKEISDKIKADKETFEESGRLYLEYAVIAIVNNQVWWATRED